MRATFEKKRGKLLSKRQEVIYSDLSQSKSSLREPQAVRGKEGRDGSIRRALEQAQAMLEEEREQREELQKKVARLQLRGIDREKEFRRIIQEGIPFCLKDRSSAVLNADLRLVHQKLLSFFEASQSEVERSLEEERCALEEQMERRIQELTAHAEQEVQQHRRMHALQYETVHREISTALEHCSAILGENEGMKRTIRELSFNNAVLKEERGMLIEEVLEKKTLILRMHAQLREKYSRDDQIDREIALLKRQRIAVDQQYAHYEQTRPPPDHYSTIDAIRPRAAELFATDPAKHRPARPHSNDKSASRFGSTADAKARSTVKASLHRTVATCSSEGAGAVGEGQLREWLRRERRKGLQQAQKIEWLVGYKRDIDLFLRECYRSGDLQQLDHPKLIQLLEGLRRVIEKEAQDYALPAPPAPAQDYEALLEDY